MFFFGKSDIGKKRSSNQDFFNTLRLAANIVLCIVCDGMGGANGGNIASQTTVEIFTDSVSEKIKMLLPTLDTKAVGDIDTLEFPAPDQKDSTPLPAPLAILTESAEEANKAVYQHAKEDPNLDGMGTTLVSALVVDDKLYAINIGDSRLYMITTEPGAEDDSADTEMSSEMRQLSHDHSYVQYLVDIGELKPDEAAKSPHRNIITRAIGIDSAVKADTFCVDLSGEKNVCYFMLCSDGLTNYLEESEIQRIILGNNKDVELSDPEEIEEELERKTEQLIREANENGGGDNITAVIMKHVPTQNTIKTEPDKKEEPEESTDIAADIASAKLAGYEIGVIEPVKPAEPITDKGADKKKRSAVKPSTE